MTYQAVLLSLIADSDSVAPHLESCRSSNDPFYEEGRVRIRSQRRIDGGKRE
jgi:hypothetical protein